MKTIRRILITAAVVLVAGGLTNQEPTAMAIKGQCDPGPIGYNFQAQYEDNGQVGIETRYGWDGTSVYPECIGPIQQVRVFNTGQQTWRVNVPLSRRSKTLDIVPGTDRTFTGAQLVQVGLETNTDISELTLTLKP